MEKNKLEKKKRICLITARISFLVVLIGIAMLILLNSDLFENIAGNNNLFVLFMVITLIGLIAWGVAIMKNEQIKNAETKYKNY